MPKLFLLEQHPAAVSANGGTVQEFAKRMQAGESDLYDIAEETLRIVGSTLIAVTDEEIAEYAVPGRGADFTALQLFMDDERDDMLRLHLYPRNTRDDEYHRHSRHVLSTLACGGLINATAQVAFCAPEDAELDVWDCNVVDDASVPVKNNEIGARLSSTGEETVMVGDTYQIPTDVYHRVKVVAGTVSMCWFTRSGMQEQPVVDGRIVKPREVALEPIPPLVPADIQDLRVALGEYSG